MTKSEKQAEELRLIDLIIDEGMRDGLQSMIDHPEHLKLKKLQDELYQEE